MKVIGLTGSLAMGKSEVARILARHGAAVLGSDAVVHAIYEDGSGAAALREDFPSCVANGKVDRRKLLEIVLADEAKFRRLEELIHPLVRMRQDAFIAASKAAGAGLVILDVPLLFEADDPARFDSVVVVSAPASRQRHWALARPGMSEEKFRRLSARQMPDEEKRKRASYVVVNDGDLAQLESRTLAVLRKIRENGRKE